MLEYRKRFLWHLGFINLGPEDRCSGQPWIPVLLTSWKHGPLLIHQLQPGRTVWTAKSSASTHTTPARTNQSISNTHLTPYRHYFSRTLRPARGTRVTSAATGNYTRSRERIRNEIHKTGCVEEWSVKWSEERDWRIWQLQRKSETEWRKRARETEGDCSSEGEFNKGERGRAHIKRGLWDAIYINYFWFN